MYSMTFKQPFFITAIICLSTIALAPSASGIEHVIEQQTHQIQTISQLLLPPYEPSSTINTTTRQLYDHNTNNNNNNNLNTNNNNNLNIRKTASTIQYLTPNSRNEQVIYYKQSNVGGQPTSRTLNQCTDCVHEKTSETIVSATNGLVKDTTVNDNSQGCSRNPCGSNALCQETAGGRPVCSCPSGYSGNPLTGCRRAECLDHTECRGDQSCRNGNCVFACTGVCGVNANCETRNHVPVCSCPAGYKGDPFSQCRLMDPEELCNPSPCGQNTKCEVINNVPTCSCLKNFIGSPIAGCRHECESDGECGAQESCRDFRCTSSCTLCGKGAQCVRVTNHRAVCECPKGYIGSPYTECRAECYSDGDCPRGKPACYNGVCKNPCSGSCGVNADCNLRGLTPICSCPRDMTGNPFISCRPFTKQDLCEPNPCGQNAQCTPGYDNTNKERPVCTCLPGYTGNALSYCSRGECQSDAECSDNRACIGYQCVDPCAGQCGAGANCQSKRHIAVCTCPSGTQGDALVSCRQSRVYPVSRYY